jgi:membrane associated rhomboid family serine protease
MRRNPFDSRLSATLMLVIINVVIFVLQWGVENFSRFPLTYYFALHFEGLRHGYVWQLLTFQFMHGGIIHLLVNCWVLYMFGRELESALGRNRFLNLYFSSGVLGGLLQVLAGAMAAQLPPSAWTQHFMAPTVGASAGVYGLVAAYATLYPDRLLTMLLFFFIPITMRAKFLLAASAVLAVLGMLNPSSNMADAAHLGGMLTGVLFIRYALEWNWNWNWHWPRWPHRRLRVHRPSRADSAASGFWKPSKAKDDEELPPEEFLRREVDPILDKISAQGIQSLTARERRILEAAREKMVKR